MGEGATVTGYFRQPMERSCNLAVGFMSPRIYQALVDGLTGPARTVGERCETMRDR